MCIIRIRVNANGPMQRAAAHAASAAGAARPTALGPVNTASSPPGMDYSHRAWSGASASATYALPATARPRPRRAALARAARASRLLS